MCLILFFCLEMSGSAKPWTIPQEVEEFSNLFANKVSALIIAHEEDYAPYFKGIFVFIVVSLVKYFAWPFIIQYTQKYFDWPPKMSKSQFL